MGADPDHNDIFIEVDFMANHRIEQAEIDAVTVAFEQAPVPNPDGRPGITLHVDNGSSSVMDPASGATWGSLSDQESLPHQNTFGSDFVLSGQTRYDWSEFESTRQTKLLGIRRPAFHYVIAAHSGPSQRFAGIARGIPSADFLMAMHENCGAVRPLAEECPPHPEYTASTFMHELGHNLSLRHGGTDGSSRKPNYLSIMNYNFGYGLVLFDGSFELDYSRYELPLDENALDEQRGFGIDSGPLTAYQTIFRCPGGGPRYRIPLTTKQVDWNCTRSISTLGTVAADVSDDGRRTLLTGPIDWDRIVFSGGGIGGLNPPPAPDSTVIDEPPPANLLKSREQLERGTAPPLDPTPPVVVPSPDTTAPNTKIERRAKKRSKHRRATYAFSSSEAGSNFECRSDRKKFKPCSSPKKLKRLKRGKHSFAVRAIDAAGNVDSTPARHRFRVLR